MGKYLKLAIIGLFFLSFQSSPNGLHPANDGFALVELFTSEGCSSCPPAETLVTSLPKSYPNGVYILSFHVDYWDRLGWKDRFSRAEFTQRQQRYGEALRLNSIYTPQVVVNGRTEMVGSDKIRVRKAIDEQLTHTANPNIDASAHTTDNKTVTVDYALTNKTHGAFHAALVQLEATTAVRAGENAGLRMHHSNIVRDLQSSTANRGALTLSLPAGLAKEECKVIVFLQDDETLQVEGARLLDIH
jgi:hypothetical protein